MASLYWSEWGTPSQDSQDGIPLSASGCKYKFVGDTAKFSNFSGFVFHGEIFIDRGTVSVSEAIITEADIVEAQTCSLGVKPTKW